VTERTEIDPELTAGYYEGDMVMDLNRNGLITTAKRWPNNTVYYTLSKEFDEPHRNHILRGMEIIEQVSCIRFKEAPSNKFDYVHIRVAASGCSSNIGYLGLPQYISLEIWPLDTGCFRMMTIVHEILHTIGFYHMQSSWDRDDYVKIVEENIDPQNIRNFNKYNETQVDHFDEEYDYASIMHYGPKAFSINKEDTIIPLRSDKDGTQMGQRLYMPQSDINRLNMMYRCPIKQ